MAGNAGIDLSLQVSAQILAVISQHATNGECEKTSYDDFYLEVLPDSSVLITAETWLPAADSEVHVIGGSDFAALPAVLKWAAKARAVDLLTWLVSVCCFVEHTRQCYV